MRLRDLLNVPKGDLKSWGVIVPQAVADAMASAQTGQMRVAPVPLVDGRAMFCADVLAHETGAWFAAGLGLVERDDCQCAPWPACAAMLDGYDGEDAPPPPDWVPILGAGLGPHGAVDGYLPASLVTYAGLVREQRSAIPAVNAPRDDGLPTEWAARAPGGGYLFRVPSGWQYQPGEDVTEDGETWHRCTQPTSFPPSAGTGQWVQIDGPGGEVVQPPEPEPDEWPAWVQPTHAGDAYAVGAKVTYNGRRWVSEVAGNIWAPGVYGWRDEGPP